METLMIKHDSQRWSDSDIDRLSGYTIFKIQVSRVSTKSDTFFKFFLSLKIVCPLPEFENRSQDSDILNRLFYMSGFEKLNKID